MPSQDTSTNKEFLKKIIDEIFQITNPAIEKARESEIYSFIETIINGDTSKEYLVITASLEESKMAILVYILTDKRLIKIDITPIQGIKSASFLLSSMSGVQRDLEADRSTIRLNFQSGSVGLRYDTANQKINNFFQQVELHNG